MYWIRILVSISATVAALAASCRYLLDMGGPHRVKLPEHLVNHAVDDKNGKNTYALLCDSN